jgi:putative protease
MPWFSVVFTENVRKNHILEEQIFMTKTVSDGSGTPRGPLRRKPELLAPAGSWDSFVAALDAGADAIYLGLDAFNARRGAKNFSLQELGRACRLAHLSGRRIYLTLNILISTDEMQDALSTLSDAWRAGIDAVIVQDLGLLARIREELPGLEVHTSTQMNLHNRAGVALARRLGASRVTLARELTLDELADLAREGLDLEVFAHGALCVCYSGQCLMSSLIGRRSANRGMCAQPCRLSWQLVDERGQELATPGEHLLSPKDLCTIDLLPQLMDAGVASLKVEGRMKSPSYVSTVCRTYRDCIDRAFEHPSTYVVTDDERSALEEAFSRGFTTAYFEGESGPAMMSFQRANNRGTLVGRVGSIAHGRVELSLTRGIARDDVLEFWTSRGQRTLTVGEMLVAGRPVETVDADDAPLLVVPFPVAPGDRVFRVRNERAERDAAERVAAFCGVPTGLSFAVEARRGKPLRIRVSDAEGRCGEAVGATVEPARTKALTRDDVVKHVDRLGGTPYHAISFDVQLDEGIGMGFSQLHRVRAAAIEDYERRILAPWDDRRSPSLKVSPREHESARAGHSSTKPLEVGVIVDDASVAARCREVGADVVYLSLDGYRAVASQIDVSGPQTCIMLPNVVHDDVFDDVVEQVCASGCPAVADDITLLQVLAERGVVVEAGPHCNVFNRDAERVVADTLGAGRLWLSPELALSDMDVLMRGKRLPYTLTVFGRQELMVTEHCVLSALGCRSEECASCQNRTGFHSLRDKKRYEFPVTTDVWGRGHVWNSVPLDVVPQLVELSERGVDRFVVDARLLDATSAVEAVHRAALARDAVMRGERPIPFEKSASTTTGHLFRGVL